MPFQNPTQWIRALPGQKLGFRYEPGSLMRDNGVKDEYFQLNSTWQRMHRDAVKVASSKFGPESGGRNRIEISNTKPDGVV